MTEDPWKHLTDEARKAAPKPLSPSVSPPAASDFRKTVAALCLRLLWRRSSLAVAVLAGFAWLGIFLLSRCEKSPTPLIPLPAENIPNPAQP